MEPLARSAARLTNALDKVLSAPSDFVREYHEQKEKYLATKQQRRQPKHSTRRGVGRSVLIGTAFGAACAVAGALAARWVRHKYCDTIVASTGVSALIAEGYAYDPDSRDCLEGEKHDYVDIEDIHQDEGTDGDGTTAPSGAGSTSSGRAPARGPAVRRIAVRKKYVHKTHTGGLVNSNFLGHVVAQARLVYNGRDANTHNKNLARSYMVRLMTEANMRPQHIDEHIDKMILAVFFLSDDQITEMKNEKKLRALGRLRHGVGE